MPFTYLDRVLADATCTTQHDQPFILGRRELTRVNQGNIKSALKETQGSSLHVKSVSDISIKK